MKPAMMATTTTPTHAQTSVERLDVVMAFCGRI